MKTFREFVKARDRVLTEADESKHLRRVLIANMGLEDIINQKTGEDIPLEQLDLDVIAKRLKGSALWTKLPEKSQKRAEEIFRQPMNRRLAELLDTLTAIPIKLAKVTTQDDGPTPQTTAKQPPDLSQGTDNM
jgi:hypothetical protein